MAGRPRKLVEVLELTKSFRPEQHRQRQAVPKFNRPIGDLPEHLALDEAAVWHEMTASLPAGVLTLSDQARMEVVARLTAWQRRGGLLRACASSAPVLAATGAARDRNPAEGALIAPPRPRAR